MQRYDVFAYCYDATTEPIHRGHRVDAVAQLRLPPGGIVLDVPCGTGSNLPRLRDAVGAAGRVIGCDASPGMLRRARDKVRAQGWDNVELHEADARAVGPDLLGTDTVDGVISMLGMTVMPDWEGVFERTWDLLRPGGRYVIMDLYLAGRPFSRSVDAFYRLVAGADSTRRVWEPLERRVTDFERRDDPRLGGVAFIAAGTKPLD